MNIKKKTFRWLAVSAIILSCWGCAGKDDASDADAPDEEGLRLCCELGALCQVADDETDTEVSECHDLGHDNIPEECRKEHDRCTVACTTASDEPAPHDCE